MMQSNKKAGRYQRILEQISKLIDNNNGLIAHLATINALLYHKIPYYFWSGFYLLNKDEELIVGPYQGPVACQKLKKNTGVCWSCINKKEPIIVPNVEEFPDHIACDSRSKSEIVVPLFIKGELKGVLDVDSKDLNSFNEVDEEYLIKILNILNK